jgi:hypothetical protein
VPVLVLSSPGTVGTSLETARRTAERFPNGKLLETPSPMPSIGFGLGECGYRAADRFLHGRRVQDRCPRELALLPPARPAPRSLGELPPAGGVPGRRGRLLYALSVTFGDLVDSFYSEALQNIGADEFDVGLHGGGLRGGSFAITERDFRLNRYEYVPGVRFTSRWKTESNRLGPLHIDGPGSLDGVLLLREADDLTFRVRGRLAGRRVHTSVRIRSRLLELFSSIETGGGPAQVAPRGPNLRSDAPGSCRLPLLRDLPGACAHG